MKRQRAKTFTISAVAEQFDPVDGLEVEVDDQQVVGDRRVEEQRGGLGGADGGVGVDALQAEDAREELAAGQVVFDDQRSGRSGFGGDRRTDGHDALNLRG